jgi:D-alanyl-lipoteichoic acid acyltransferase DltB (MBOAT superfamily)
MLFTTAVTYGGALLLERADQKGGPPEKVVRKKKRIAAFSIVLVLLVLGYYKYFNFASEMLEKLFGVIGLNISVPRFSILLPIGISFFTFQSIGYLVDVYRKDVEAEHNFLRYALFVSFFPQLIAGPIERSRNLLGQLSVPHKFNFDMAREGLLLMLWGYFLIIVMADRIAIFVDTVFGSYTQFGGWYLVVANLLMAIQVYCDFYGYSVLARGAAKFLGINLMENFNAPYFSM